MSVDFATLLIAAMTDAAVEGICCQLQTRIQIPSGAMKIVRIVVIPEEMDYVRTDISKPFKKPI